MKINLKLFYHSTVYKNKKNGDGIIQCRQFGCEYLGEPSIDADREVVNLAFNILFFLFVYIKFSLKITTC